MERTNKNVCHKKDEFLLLQKPPKCRNSVFVPRVLFPLANTQSFWKNLDKKSASHLQHGEVGLAWQTEFLLLRRVGVEAVLVQPAPQNLHRLLGQVAAATALPKEPSPWQVEWGAVIAVRHSRGVLLLRAMLVFQSWGEGRRVVSHISLLLLRVCHLSQPASIKSAGRSV